MTSHLLKSKFIQCECRWCGKRYGDCQVTMEMRDAIAKYAQENGRTWKRKLSDEWTAGHNIGPVLQQVRNILGPSQLYKISPTVLKLHRQCMNEQCIT
jgi:hypothetical protein